MLEKIPALKKLHKTVFQDGDNYVEFFFDYRFNPDYCWIHEEDGEPVGAAYARSVAINLGGKQFTVPFITGVATLPQYRGKGIASQLVKRALSQFENSRIPFSLLHPFNADFYRKLNYEAINFARELVINYVPLDGITYREINNEDIPFLYELYQDTVSRLFAAGVRDEKYIADIWQEHNKDGGTGYIIYKNGNPNGYILCGDGEVFENLCKQPSLIFAVKEIDGFKYKELFSGEPYSMAAAGNITALLTSVPLKKGARGEYVFSVSGENYLLSISNLPNGKASAVCEKSELSPSFNITKRQLISIALGGGKRYANGIPEGFLSLFPEYEIFIYDRF